MKRVKKCLAGWVAAVFVLTLMVPTASAPSPLRVTFLSPNSAASLRGIQVPVRVSVQARGAVKVDLLVNGRLCQTREASGSSEISFDWNTASLAAGKYGLTLVAREETGEQASARIDVQLTGTRTALRTPEIQWPPEGQAVSGKVEVRVRAGEGEEGNIVLLVDGRLAAITNIPPFRFELDTKTLAEGPHVLQVEVYQPSGEVASSAAVEVQVAGGRAAVAAAPRPGALVSKAEKAQDFPRADKPGIEVSPALARVSPTEISSPSAGEMQETAAQPKAEVGQSWELSLTAGPGGNPAPAAVSLPEPPLEEASTSAPGKEFASLPSSLSAGHEQQFQAAPEGAAVSTALPPTPETTEKKSLSVPLLPESKPSGVVEYLVKPGDSLWGISRKYGVSVEAVAQANGLGDTGAIRAGQRLRLPVVPALSVEGKTLPGAGPFFSQGKLLVPLRTIVEAAGGSVRWNGKTRTVTITSRNGKAMLKVDSAKALVNGKEMPLAAHMVLQAGRAFVPLEGLREMASVDLRYDPRSNRLILLRKVA